MAKNTKGEQLTKLEANLAEHEAFMDHLTKAPFMETFGVIMREWQQEGQKVMQDVQSSASALKNAQIQLALVSQLKSRFDFLEQRIAAIKQQIDKLTQEDK